MILVIVFIFLALQWMIDYLAYDLKQFRFYWTCSSLLRFYTQKNYGDVITCGNICTLFIFFRGQIWTIYCTVMLLLIPLMPNRTFQVPKTSKVDFLKHKGDLNKKLDRFPAFFTPFHFFISLHLWVLLTLPKFSVGISGTFSHSINVGLVRKH